MKMFGIQLGSYKSIPLHIFLSVYQAYGNVDVDNAWRDYC